MSSVGWAWKELWPSTNTKTVWRDWEDLIDFDQCTENRYDAFAPAVYERHQDLRKGINDKQTNCEDEAKELQRVSLSFNDPIVSTQRIFKRKAHKLSDHVPRTRPHVLQPMV